MNNDITRKLHQEETLEYVLQRNAISQGMYNLGTTARRLIAMAMRKMKDDYRAEFSVGEFIAALGLKKGSETARYILSAVRECMDSHIEILYPNGDWVAWTWFTVSRLLTEKEVKGADGKKVLSFIEASPINVPDHVPLLWDKIIMEFNPKLGEAIKEFKGYAAIDLLDFGKLQSRYAQRFYELAMSYRGNEGKHGNRPGHWWFYRTIAELRSMFGIPKSKYKVTNNFRHKVIDQPIDEINDPDKGIRLHIDTDYSDRRGRRLIGVKFDCWELDKDDPRPVNPATETDKEIGWLETTHPEKFEECIDEAIKNNPQPDFFIPENIRRLAAKIPAIEIFRKKYHEIKFPETKNKKEKKK